MIYTSNALMRVNPRRISSRVTLGRNLLVYDVISFTLLHV